MSGSKFSVEVMDKVHVTNPIILLAKQFLVTQDFTVVVEEALERFIHLYARPCPEEIVYSGSPTDEQINQMSQYISYGLAFCEAVWSLVHNGYFYASQDRQYTFRPFIRTKEVWSNQTSTTTVEFNEVSTMTPFLLRVNLSIRNKDNPEYVLFNPELYVAGIGSNLHRDVQEALGDAIACFQNELYRPTVTLLGKAVEGAWVELGISLYTFAGKDLKDPDKLIDKLRNETNFMNRVQQVVKLYEGRHDLFGELIKESKVSIPMIKEIFYWSDVVRDSRNAIHFGVESAFPNTYEKTVVLLMSASSNLKTLYKLKGKADKLNDKGIESNTVG
ncbi:hypothetical protein BSK59_21450 [Paenibacillus odorifer]|uniref:hypothetical protein n=1 Tax=Paenibacillus odorifer TaxID=189426 RepID=UPI00096D8E5D|nr:hypothetical protein [Paenibacillus odorifer]OME50906.1 hypothetical protein BSK59_21450 [Paenibacillus odorifer]